MKPEDIIVKPVITEKSNYEAANGKYTFKVNKSATKVDIRLAVEQLFNVKVLKVNTQIVYGKMKRQGATSGRTATWKKAIVTIDTNPQADTYKQKGGKIVTINRKYNNTISEFGATN